MEALDATKVSLGQLSSMKVLTTKTARFTTVVEECGVPEVFTLWRPPQEDRQLRKQIEQNHIMTIQRSSAGSEFGTVGFLARKNSIHLRFPKSLKRYADQRIVGIKWELVKK